MMEMKFKRLDAVHHKNSLMPKPSGIFHMYVCVALGAVFERFNLYVYLNI